MIIIKFGGTSVQDVASIRSVINIVKAKLHKQPIVVVSAVAGATNQLIESARCAVAGKKEESVGILNSLRNRHLEIAEDLIKDSGELDNVNKSIDDIITKLANLVEGVSLIGELTNRSLDMFAAQGELLSSNVIAPAMKEAELEVKWFDARQVMITDEQYASAIPNIPVLADKCRTLITPLFKEWQVVLTQGFIGSTSSGITTTLGRGGSDYSAALLGAAMDAEDIEIWTDVDGVLTTDPRIVPHAKRVKQMSFREASELAYFGAKVLHPATIIPAVEKNIPVHVYNTKNPDFGGTLIAAKLHLSKEAQSSSCVIKSIAFKKDITIFNITSSRMLLAHGFLYSIFEIFKKHKTAVDVVSTTEVSVSLTIDNLENLESIVRDLSAFSQVQVESKRAIVCLVGEQMRKTAGIAARTFGAIRDININMVSQGASEINLTFVIDEKDVDAVVKRLHDEFFSGPLPADIFE
ncbi:lysine-sensitive aspartokinase 3 [bacterium]|nr:MAG: lysine-sensitive aspartokinase 3 [bacterium]